jgi:hypothetical protein
VADSGRKVGVGVLRRWISGYRFVSFKKLLSLMERAVGGFLSNVCVLSSAAECPDKKTVLPLLKISESTVAFIASLPGGI